MRKPEIKPGDWVRLQRYDEFSDEQLGARFCRFGRVAVAAPPLYVSGWHPARQIRYGKVVTDNESDYRLVAIDDPDQVLLLELAYPELC